MKKVINADRILHYMKQCGAKISWNIIFAHCQLEAADGDIIGTVNCRTYFRFLREKIISKSGSDYSKDYYTLTVMEKGEIKNG
jgi:hypothetical protein